jgi:hypothetical protein
MKTKFAALAVTAPAVCLLACTLCLPALSQGTAFTYQGRLNDGASAANGTYDVRFIAFDNSAGGGQQGPILTNFAATVSSGLFTVTLDFGNQFPGANRWLEIGVRTNGSGAFTTLTPRQKIAATPYAITASNLSGTLPAGQLSGNIGSANLTGTYGNAVTLNNAANSFSGSGAGLTGLNAANLTGAVPSAALTSVPAGSLTGTVLDARLSANVALLSGSQTFTGAKSFSSEVVATSGVRINNTNLWFKGDNQHGLGWYGTGRPFAGISTVDGPVLFGYSGGALATEQFGTERIALLWNGAGNVGIGTVTPSVRLDVSGAIRASGGVVFPDGSTQFRATDISPLVTSGLPNGSTFTVTIGGTVATLSGQYRLIHALSAGSGGTPTTPYLYCCPITGGGTIKVRRPRTSDLTWQGWAAGTLRTLTMLLTVPGGSTVTWSNSVNPAAINLTQSGGTLYEELELKLAGPLTTETRLNRVVSGAPLVSAPSGDLTGITLSLNGSTIPNISFFSPFASTRWSFDPTTGLPTGGSFGPVFHIRANPFSNQTLYSRFITGGAPETTTITAGGGTLITVLLSPTLYIEYVLRLADDGLPIEEFTLAMDLYL